MSGSSFKLTMTTSLEDKCNQLINLLNKITKETSELWEAKTPAEIFADEVSKNQTLTNCKALLVSLHDYLLSVEIQAELYNRYAILFSNGKSFLPVLTELLKFISVTVKEGDITDIEPLATYATPCFMALQVCCQFLSLESASTKKSGEHQDEFDTKVLMLLIISTLASFFNPDDTALKNYSLRHYLIFNDVYHLDSRVDDFNLWINDKRMAYSDISQAELLTRANEVILAVDERAPDFGYYLKQGYFLHDVTARENNIFQKGTSPDSSYTRLKPLNDAGEIVNNTVPLDEISATGDKIRSTINAYYRIFNMLEKGKLSAKNHTYENNI